MDRRKLSFTFTTAMFVILPLVGPMSAPLAQQTARAPRGVSLQTVVADMSRSSGVLVLADTTVARETVPPPATSATADTLEQQVQALIPALPHGATWVKLYLPVAGAAPNADAAVQYAMAQARLLGRRIGGSTPAGTVEVMGQTLPVDKARDVVAALNLKLVYLITNPSAPASAATAGKLEQFANMDSNGRLQMMQQMQQQMMDQARDLKTMLSQMSPAEQDQFHQMLASQGLMIKVRTGPGGP